MKQKFLETEKWTFFLTKGGGGLVDLYILILWAHRERRFISQQKKEIFYKGGGRKCCRPVFINYMSIYIKGIYESASKKK